MIVVLSESPEEGDSRLVSARSKPDTIESGFTEVLLSERCDTEV